MEAARYRRPRAGVIAALIAGMLMTGCAAVGAHSLTLPHRPDVALSLLAAQSPAGYSFVANRDANSVTEYAERANGNQVPVATISGSNTGLHGPVGVALDPAGNLFVVNTASVTEYAPGATGDVAPIAAISGPATRLNDPVHLTVDPAGDLFVADAYADGGSVLEYARGATGDVAPIAAISGPATRLVDPAGVALDPAGDLFVADAYANGGGAVTEYAPGATGDAAPIATISGPATGLSEPIDVALDSAGDLFVANLNGFVPGLTGPPGSVTEYAPGATGNAAPIATISSYMNGPCAVALDSAGDLFVADAGGSVTEYAAGATGNAAPIAVISGPATGLGTPLGLALVPSAPYSFAANVGSNSVTEYAKGASGSQQVPAAIIQGPDTGLSNPDGVALDPAGDLFVANSGNGSVIEYAPGAFGNVAPIATISGPATGLSEPDGVVLDPAGDLFVANSGNGSVIEYAPGAFGNVAPIATISGPATGLSGPAGLALDPAGNLFVANQTGDSVTEYAPAAKGDAAPIVTISTSNPFGVVVDPAGNVFVAGSGTDEVNEYEGLPSNIVLVGAIGGPITGLNHPAGLAMDPAGNLFVANFGGNSMTEYAPRARGNQAPRAAIAGSLSLPAAVALLPARTVPGAPVIGTAAAGNASATVTFTPPSSDGGSPVTSYTVTATDLTTPANGGRTATGTGSPLTITGLTNGDTYTLSVTASNAVGAGPSSRPSNAVAPATVPSAPRGLTATAANAQVLLSWTAPSSAGGRRITGYDVYRGTTPGGEGTTPVNPSPLTTTSYTVTGLPNGTPYDFVVKAINAAGASPASNEASATPQAPAISLSPGHGTAETPVSITGGGFPPGKTVVIHLDSPAGTPMAATTAGSSGEISLVVKVPATTYGTHQAVAVGPGGTALARAPFKVLAALVLSPASVTTGTVVHVTLTGFRAGQAITVRFNSAAGTMVSRTRTASDGQASTSFRASRRPGTYRVYAAASGGPQASAMLKIGGR